MYVHAFRDLALHGVEWSALDLDVFTPGKEPQVPITYEAGWVLWRRENQLVSGIERQFLIQPIT
jgi:hypothetical protein